MRRNVGRARARQRVRVSDALQETGAELRAAEIAHMVQQWGFIEDKLREFAQEHRTEINTKPEFRREFMKMCVDVGVDPLLSTKSSWGSAMGNLSQFYHELGVQILDVCYGTRAQNGGIIPMDDLVRKLRWLRGGKADQQISCDDVATSLEHLKVLGSGLRLVEVASGAGKFVLSVPQEFDLDHQIVLAAAREGGGFVSESQLKRAPHNWGDQRIDRALKQLVQSGMVWVDDQADAERLYWFPSLFGEEFFDEEVESKNELTQ